MKFSYQIGTPDLQHSDLVTCMQGDFETNIQKLAAYGYDSVEIMSTYPKSINWEQIKAILDKHGMTVSLVCTGELGLLGYTLSNPDDAVRLQAFERIKELIDVAEFFGTGINIGNTKGRYNDKNTKEETERRTVEGFQILCDYAKPKNVTIAVETGAFVFINFLNTCAEAAALIERVGRDNIGLMLDIFHLHIEEKNLIEAIKQYTPMCYHVHLADSNRKYPGAGGLDFTAILNAFHAAGYDAAFTVEVRQTPDSHTAAEQSAKTLVPILKHVYGPQS